MNANPILLQMKYARVVSLFAKNTGVTLDEALKIFYHSVLYLAEELEEEYAKNHK